ncbi:MAG: hypothetical protein R3C28_33865 [Pirellulaceae bacterium]
MPRPSQVAVATKAEFDSAASATRAKQRGWSWLFALPFLLAVVCFAPRLPDLWRTAESPAIAAQAKNRPTAKFLTKPIEQIRPGDRVLAHNPEVTDEERAAAPKVVAAD